MYISLLTKLSIVLIQCQNAEVSMAFLKNFAFVCFRGVVVITSA